MPRLPASSRRGASHRHPISGRCPQQAQSTMFRRSSGARVAQSGRDTNLVSAGWTACVAPRSLRPDVGRNLTGLESQSAHPKSKPYAVNAGPKSELDRQVLIIALVFVQWSSQPADVQHHPVARVRLLAWPALAVSARVAHTRSRGRGESPSLWDLHQTETPGSRGSLPIRSAPLGYLFRHCGVAPRLR
jgi:hypothetical protein